MDPFAEASEKTKALEDEIEAQSPVSNPVEPARISDSSMGAHKSSEAKNIGKIVKQPLDPFAAAWEKTKALEDEIEAQSSVSTPVEPSRISDPSMGAHKSSEAKSIGTRVKQPLDPFAAAWEKTKALEDEIEAQSPVSAQVEPSRISDPSMGAHKSSEAKSIGKIVKQPLDPFAAAWEKTKALEDDIEAQSPVSTPVEPSRISDPSMGAHRSSEVKSIGNKVEQPLDPFAAAWEITKALEDEIEAQSSVSTPVEPSRISDPSMGASGSNLSTVKNEEKKEEEDEEAIPLESAKIKEILSQFTVEQLDRYEHYTRSKFTKAKMRKLVQDIAGNGTAVSDKVFIVISAATKMFVGDIVENARIVMTQWKDTGPIRPRHIRESYRRLKLEGKVPKRSVPRRF